MDVELTQYETNVAAEFEAWRAKPPSRAARTFGRLTQVVDKPTEWVLDKTVLGKVAGGILQVAMDAGSWAVPTAKIVTTYREQGLPLGSFDEIRRRVPLESRDRLAARLAKSYRRQLGVEGGAAGAAAVLGPEAGIPALLADVAFVTTWACRATAHHAAVYGYRVETPPERAMAMQVLVGATSPTDAAKQAALSSVMKLSKQIAQKKTWEQLEKNALVVVVQEAAEQTGVRLTKAKLGQVVAVVGVLIGAGYNAWYIDKVCEWGYWTYRSHYLEDKLAGFADRDERSELARATTAEGVGNAEAADAAAVE
jgi:hypothetical protein